MATFGAEKAIIGIYGTKKEDKNKIIKKITVDQTSGSLVSANITGLEGSKTKKYGSNVLWKAFVNPIGELKIDFEFNALPFAQANELLGIQQENGIYRITNKTKAPRCSVEIISADADEEVAAHIGIVRGVFSRTGIDAKTNDANVQHSPDKFTFDAESGWNGQTALMYIEDETDEEEKKRRAEWEKIMFPGYQEKVNTYDQSQYGKNSQYQ